MPRAFAHVRLSTVGQTALNQIREIAAAGFAFEPHRVVAETVSGSEAIARRREFGRLLDRLERGNVLVVTRLDRLGRDAIDVAATVGRLEASGVRVHCLALGGVDLASSAGKMTMGVIIAVAQIERDLLIERPQSGLARAEGGGRRARARAEGKPIGCPRSLSATARAAVMDGLATGENVTAPARRHRTGRQTVMRIRDAASRIEMGAER